MKTNLLPSIILTITLLVLLGVAYPLVLLGIAQIAPNSGEGFTTETANGKNYTNLGQAFTSDHYFWSRPSTVAYNAAGSGASNKATSNEAYLAEVQTRLDDFLARNPEVAKEAVPVDLLTASGSGLDPNISVQGAKVQLARIAKARNIEINRLEQLVTENTQQPLFGLFGPQKINVLELNIALDKLAR